MIGADGRVAVVGSAGVVGRELVELLGQRQVERPRLLGRSRRSFRTPSGVHRQESLSNQSLEGLDVVFFCADGKVAEAHARRVAADGAISIDNSSAFRLVEDVPLVVPEVNGEALLESDSRLISNPNCSTILLLMAVAPLHRAFGCSRLDVATYQAVSGAGEAAMGELEEMSRAELSGDTSAPRVFREPVAFNVFSHDSPVDLASGYNGEELKMIREVEKILDDPPAVTATCVRVPVWRSHCEAVTVELRRPVTEEEFRRVLAAAPGVRLVDSREANGFPTARGVAGEGDVAVGRIRPDRSRPAEPGPEARWRAFHLFLAGDQLLKGAALNALQIADLALGGTTAPRSRARPAAARLAR